MYVYTKSQKAKQMSKQTSLYRCITSQRPGRHVRPFGGGENPKEIRDILKGGRREKQTKSGDTEHVDVGAGAKIAEGKDKYCHQR